MIICISGVPGTGKTTLAKFLAKELRDYTSLDLNTYIKKNRLYESYDPKSKTYDVDKKKIIKLLKLIIKTQPNLIIDSHMSHYLSPKDVDICIVTMCTLGTLKKRLQKRRYNAQKIKENLEAAAFDICTIEAQERGHKVLKVDPSKKQERRELLKQIRNLTK